MIISAYLGLAGLTDAGYQFRNPDESANGSRITAGVVDAGDGWYSADATFPGGVTSVRWNSAGQPQIIAREYFPATATVDNTAIAAAVWQVLTSGFTTAGTVGKLVADNLNATVSSRSTYAGTDTPGTTTLLTRVPGALTITGGAVTVGTNNDKTGYSLTSAYDAAKVAAPVGAAMTLTSAYDSAKTASSQSSVDAVKLSTDHLATAMELDGAVYRFTVNALELAPTGSGGGGTTDWTATERDQIRSRLGLDGSAAVPVAANPIASQTTLLAVKAKTDALPPDPADQSDLVAQFAITNSKVDAVTAKTNNLPPDPADASDMAASFAGVNTKLDAISSGMPLDAGELNAIADTLLRRDWTVVTGEASASVLNALRSIRNKWTLSAGGTLTVYKEDNTVAWTRNVTTDANALPVTGQS